MFSSDLCVCLWQRSVPEYVFRSMGRNVWTEHVFASDFYVRVHNMVVASDLNVRVHTLRCAQTLSNAPKHPPAIHSSGPVGQGRGPDYNLIYWAKL